LEQKEISADEFKRLAEIESKNTPAMQRKVGGALKHSHAKKSRWCTKTQPTNLLLILISVLADFMNSPGWPRTALN
jgi:hypothetical protein